MTAVARLIRALLAAALLAFAPVTLAVAQNGSEVSAETPGLDYVAWDKSATRAEALIEDSATTDADLKEIRSQIADWRAALLAAQSTNATRIATLRAQIEALGPVPAEGQTEAAEISARRTELSNQLTRLQAPGIAADEAHRRADGLIREIDRILREHQADQLLTIWPSPLNPVNWPAGAKALSDTAVTIWTEVATAFEAQSTRSDLRRKLPLILVTLFSGLALLLRGRRLTDKVSRMTLSRMSPAWARVWEPLISVGQVAVPTLGLLLLDTAVSSTSLIGPIGSTLSDGLVLAGLFVLSAIWLGGRIFPKSDLVMGPFTLAPEQRVEGRFITTAFGWLVAIVILRDAIFTSTAYSDAARAVLTLPGNVIAGVLLYRLGKLLQRHVANETSGDDPPNFINRLIRVLGSAVKTIGIVGPVLAAIGFVPAAEALVQPAALTVGLIGLLFLVQQMVENVYALLTGRTNASQDALAPVLIGFAIVVASLPVVALIWGARASDITELWTRFREGISIGETQISPTSFLVFALVFGFGYMITKLLQGVLRTAILPRTTLDQGGQNAIIAGIGYIGVFLAGLAAINSAGINLAGLALVAGALSVGIGFGLQNIVSNFVSGIILLIERPVSEGDWIEVGGVQGTVKAISVRSTRIQTFDRTDVIVPNSDLIAGRVTNWTRFNLTGRLIVPVSVAYGSDTRVVERILKEIAEAEPLAVINPAPAVLFMGFTADAMLFEIRVILRDVNFQLSVRSEMNHAIIRRFREDGIRLSLSVAAQAQGAVADIDTE